MSGHHRGKIAADCGMSEHHRVRVNPIQNGGKSPKISLGIIILQVRMIHHMNFPINIFGELTGKWGNLRADEDGSCRIAFFFY
ncbi:hypothetical protein D3C85_1514170 [compost metagenome]